MIIKTKLFIPRTNTPLITRPHLIQRLEEGLDYRITLITAPPGYGKTTILSEWAHSHSLSIAWFSLDNNDNDVLRFWSYSLAAIKQANPEFDEAAVLRFAADDPSGAGLIAGLINELNSLSKPLVLVWDDFHSIDDPSLLKGISYFLNHLPPYVYLYIASRSHPQLPLSRLRVRGFLNELKVDDMRFSVNEIAEFLNSYRELNLSMNEILVLQERTEGWVTGLRLAELSLDKKQDRSSLLREIIESQRNVADYFFEEVFIHLSESMQHFLLRTSILERMNRDLCEAVTGKPEASQLLQQVEAMNLFLVSLDGRQEWYRYHHLFQQFLYRHLQRFEMEEVKRLHRVAGKWLEENHHYYEAMEHYLAGNHFESALSLMEVVSPILMNGNWTTLSRWLNRIPDDILYHKPMLFLSHLVALFLSGKIEAATEKYWWVANQLEKNPASLPCHKMETYHAGLPFLVAFRAYLEKDFETFIEYSVQYIEREPEGKFFVGFGGEVDGYHPVSDVYVSIGDLHKAEQILPTMLKIWSGTKNVYFNTHLCIDYGILLYERNHVKKAEEYLCQALDLSIAHGNTYLAVISTIWLARVYSASKLWDKAVLTIQDVAKKMNVHDYPNLTRKLAWVQADVQKQQGNLTEVYKWIKESELHYKDEIPYSMLEEYILFANLLAMQRKDEEALVLIERLLNITGKEGEKRNIIRLLLQKSLIIAQQGGAVQCMAILEDALSLAESEGYIRIFIDAGEPFMELLQNYLVARQKQHIHQRKKVSLSYVQQLLRFKHLSYGERTTFAHIDIEDVGLTAREMMILKLLATGISNKEIARELGISLSTVKTHINNMYGKLQVGNRLQAIERAGKLNLL